MEIILALEFLRRVDIVQDDCNESNIFFGWKGRVKASADYCVEVLVEAGDNSDMHLGQ